MRRFYTLLLIVSAVAVVGCAGRGVRIAPVPVQSVSVGDTLSIRVTYLSVEELIGLYGAETNPFIRFPARMPPRDFVVFEAVLENVGDGDGAVSLPFAEATFKLEGLAGDALTRQRLQNIWYRYYKVENMERAELRRKIQLGIPRDHTVTLLPDDAKRVLLVFLKNYATSGEGVLTLPYAIDGGGDSAGSVELKFLFEDAS